MFSVNALNCSVINGIYLLINVIFLLLVPRSDAEVGIGMLMGDKGVPLLENRKVGSISQSCSSWFLIDMKFISKLLEIFYGDLQHVPVLIFDFSSF